MEVEEILDVKGLLQKNTKVEEAEEIKVEDVNQYDLGNLLVSNFQPKNEKNYFQESQIAVQELIRRVFSLPSEFSNVGPIVTLPEPTTKIPREKPLPKEKSETKWQKFAKEKGIKKRKRSRLVYDDVSGEYKPRWGKDRANDPLGDWLIEDKPGIQQQIQKYSAEDPFHLKKKMQAEKIQKQKKQEVRNLSRASKMDNKSLPATLDVTSNNPRHHKYSLERAVTLAQISNASLGKFDHKAKDEPKIKSKPKYVKTESEQEFNKKVVDRIIKKKFDGEKSMSVKKAVNSVIREEEFKNQNKTKPRYPKRGKRRRTR